VAELKKAAQKIVNFDKLREIQQEKEENPASFLSRLTEALRYHTKVDPETTDGTIILMTHFISQSVPDIRRKLKRLDNGPQTPQAEILSVAFKVYNYREEQQRADKERRDKAKFQMVAQALEKNL
jgi:ferredoxin-fold anticodon binding domain-containing protein